MRVNQIICPKCKTSLTSKAGVEVGSAIACPKCKNKFAVAAPKKVEEVFEDFEVIDDDDDETPKKKPAAPKAVAKRQEEDDEDFDFGADDAPKKKPVKKPVAKKRIDDDNDEPLPPKKRPRRDDEDDERPAPKKKARRDEEDDERPAPKKKARRDDEDDERPAPKNEARRNDEYDDEDDKPRRKKRRDDDEDDDDEPKTGYAKMKSNPWIRGSVLGVLLIIMGILGYLLYDKYYGKKAESSTSPDEEDFTKPINPNDPARFPKTPPKNQEGPKVGFNVEPKVGIKTDPKVGPKIEGELVKFQGLWIATKGTSEEKNLPIDALRNLGFTINGDRATRVVDPTNPARIQIDSRKSPAEIDFVDNKNEMSRGIYRFVRGQE